MKVGILLHIYYEDTYESIFEKIGHLATNGKNIFLINICRDNVHFREIEKFFKDRIHNCYIIASTNKGKDIGGKLALMDLYLRLNLKSDLLLFLHDKKSPQLIEGHDWQEELFHIIDKENIDKILETFLDDEIGMIGNKANIINRNNNTDEKIFAGGKDLILSVAKSYDIDPKNYSFIGGTMFWVRSNIYEKFFSLHPPLEVRSTLEEKNVMDDFGPTITHSWERLLGWIVLSSNKKISGI